MSGTLEVNNISCAYDGLTVINGLSFTLNKGDIGCLLGPSGCGKSTILRAIAGFEPLTSGSIKLNEVSLSSETHITPPEKRNIGMVFQDYALFPHLTVQQNIGFGLGKRKEKQNSTKIMELIELVDLRGYEDRFPHELSGGQQQRVSLARALAPEPSLIMLDEPFSNLDAELRTRLSLDVREILKELGMSAILVTHDQQEAFSMSDHIGVIDSGQIQQWDTPYNLYHEPANQFVASFVGRGTFLKGQTISPDTFRTELGEMQGNRAYRLPVGSQVSILIRPDDIVYDEKSDLRGVITNKTFAGTSTLYQIELPSGDKIEGLFPSHQDLYVGNEIGFNVEAEHLIAYLETQT